MTKILQDKDVKKLKYSKIKIFGLEDTDSSKLPIKKEI